MALFGKKLDVPPTMPPLPAPPAQKPQTRAPELPTPGRSFGVSDLILLMKTIPIDHHPDLVVQVVKSTLESVGVHVSDIIDDALRHEGAMRDRVSGVESEIDGFMREIESRRELIAQIEEDIAHLVQARQTREGAAKSGFAPAPPVENGPHAHSP